MAIEPDILDVAAVLVVVDGEIDVVRHVEVHVAIVVDVSKSATRTPRFRSHPGLAGHILETGSAVVPVQRVGADAGHVDIVPAIVVIVGRTGAHAEVRPPDAGSIGYVGEFKAAPEVAVVSIEPVTSRFRDAFVNEGTPVDQQDIRPAVVVVVEDQRTGPHRLGHVLPGTRAVFVGEVDTGRRGDDGEADAVVLWVRQERDRDAGPQQGSEHHRSASPWSSRASARLLRIRASSRIPESIILSKTSIASE